MPSYQAIQSVLNFMWGKGQKLDIRTNKQDRTIMVRIPNEYIRRKVLEKRIWYIGTAMFQVTPWSSSGSVSVVDMGSIPLWAHLTGLPLDLRTLEGLSFAAGLIGEPKETDEFTKNIADIDMAHVKIEADLTKPLPSLIELRRTTGEIIPVHVDYPWIPPACSFFTVNILHQSRQSITCEITIAPLQRFVLTACYAANTNEERSDLWVDLINILHFSEHSLPVVNSFDAQMTVFRDTLTHLSLFDLRFSGLFFSWSNKNPTAPIAKKLDRILTNHSWIATFPHSQAFFLAPDISDHSPAVVDLAVSLPTAGTKPFKFLNYLTKHPLFYQSVLQAWNQFGSMAWNLSHLCNFSNIQKRVRETNMLLQDVQVQALSQPTQENFLRVKELEEKWNFLRSIEESYFRQRSRINWLREGDFNTTFFHRLMQNPVFCSSLLQIWIAP
ncbi:hypothetical protein Bca52824_026943 [Brassica carinata]|uniref:DUF4283 domain-containing protein n=1 Tax=Brassica carinata TaxID=52824 RepID=A0A8X7SK94_BRACI|nr:hypothetical protein Bca52824_026943 [Brassica carinata]